MLTLEAFSERLSTAIKKSGMTQARLAEKADTSSANISNYCRGKSFPPLDTLSKIANVLNVSIDWLCGLKSKPDSVPVKTLGDVARLLASIGSWGNFTIMHFTGTCIDSQSNSITQLVPCMAFLDYTLRTFLDDMLKVRQLWHDGTFDSDFYYRWLEDRLSTLSEIELKTDEHGMYIDYMDDGELPF